jgi:hypothetical protein
LPKKTSLSPEAKFHSEQIRLLNLIYQELQKINSNLALASQASNDAATDDSDEELDSYE